MEEHPLRGLIMIVVLVVINAVISAAESSFQNVNEANAEKRAAEGDKKAVRLQKFLKQPNSYINIIEIILNASCVIIGMLYAFSCYGSIYSCIINLEFVRHAGGQADLIAGFIVFLTAVILVFLVVVFGVLFPKRMAIKHAETYAYKLCFIISFFSHLFAPLSWLLEKSTNLVLRICGINPNELEDNVTEEEIISIVNEGQEQGVIEADEAEMISNIIEFTDKQAQDIMTHRKRIVAVNSEMGIKEAMSFMLGESFSRFPLYTENIDNIVGVLHLKDVMKCYMKGGSGKRRLIDIARKPYFIPDTQDIDVLFHDMQSKNVHMAIAIDEYGQTAGLVAMEDILEEIVGDIQDEYDIEEEMVIREEDGSFLVKGGADLADLVEATGIHPTDEDLDNYDTVNGLLVSLLDRIPVDGEQDIIHYCGFRFETIEIRGKMIRLVRVTKESEESESETQEVEERSEGQDT